MRNSSALSIDERLDDMPLTRFHRGVLWRISAGIFADIFDMTILGALAGALLKSEWATLDETAMMASATFAGLTVGAVLAGLSGDYFGRRAACRINLAVVAVSTLATAFAPTPGFLALMRFVTGLGLGAEAVTGYSTLSEFLPAKARDRWQGYNGLISTSATLCAALAGYLVLPTLGWRVLLVIAGVGAAAAWVYRLSLPESPRWLASKGRGAEAELIVRRMELSVPTSERTVQSVKRDVRPCSLPKPVAADLFRGDQLKRSVLAILLNTVQIGAAYGVLVWLPSFMVKQGVSIVDALAANLVMSCGAPVGVGIAMLISHRLLRRSSIMAVSALGAILSIAYAATGTPLIAGLVGFLLFAAIYALSILCISLYIPELFPTAIRLRGAGLASAIGRFASIGAPFVVVGTFQLFGVWGAMTALAALLTFQCCAVWLLGVETKGARIGTYQRAS